MANIWLRLYHDMPNDPKWRTIARAAKQPITVVIAVYVHLLTIASAAVERGFVKGLDSEDLASALDIDSEAVDAVLSAMQGRVIEGEKLSGWDNRQANREDGAAERAKAWREKKKAEKDQANAANGSRTQTNANERKRTPDKSREEEINKEQKPSRDKRESDPRHVPFKLACEMYATHKGVIFVWDGGEAKQLSSLLAASPELTLQTFQKCLNNRAKSPVPHGERPREWLGTVLRYQEGPLDQFGKPLGAGNGTTQGNHKPNAAVDRQRITHDAIRDAARRRYGAAVVDDDGRGPSIQAQPDTTPRDAGCVPPGVGGDCPEIRSDDFQGRTLEGTP